MKEKLKNINHVWGFCLIAVIVVNSCNNEQVHTKGSSTNSGEQVHDTEAHSVKIKYTCSMHPQIIRDSPGNCPICGMKLVPLNPSANEVINDSILKSTSSLENSNTIYPIAKTVHPTINANGYITYNQNNLTNIASRISGRIENLFVKYPFQQVSNGQTLFEIYSPEIYAEQQQLLFYLTNDATNRTLINASKEKLALLGLSDSLIHTIVSNKKALRIIPVNSTINGYLIDNKTTGEYSEEKAPPSNSMMTSMAEKSTTDNSIAGITIKQGSYVTKGQTIFKIANNKDVWAEIKIPATYITLLKLGQQLTFNINGELVKGKVILIEPSYQNNSPFVGLRVLCNNQTQTLKINQWVTTTIDLGEIKGLWLPLSSVVNLGLQQVVYKKSNDGIHAVKVKTGVRFEDMLQVTDGITADDEIVKEAGYISDSESFIK